MNRQTTNEQIKFRLIKTPCCWQLLCWVNPRFPNYCPECGKMIYPQVKNSVIEEDDSAWLKIHVRSVKEIVKAS
jgi:hypothetical protein